MSAITRSNAVPREGSKPVSVIYYLCLALLLTLLPVVVFLMMRHIVDRDREARFIVEASQFSAEVEQHMHGFVGSLNVAQGLFRASKSVERDEWAAFTDHLELSQHPGAMLIRYSERVLDENMQPFLDAIHNDRSLNPEGYPGYKIFPESVSAEYYPVKYMNPGDGDLRVMGFDITSEPVRRQTLLRAARSGNIVGTPPVRWLNSPSEKWVVLFSAPIYKNGSDTSTPEARMESMAGYVDIVVDVEQFFSAVFKRASSQRVPIYGRVWTGSENISSSAGTTSLPVFDSRPAAFRSGRHFQFHHATTLGLGGREWKLEFFADSHYGLSRPQLLLPLFAGVAGLLVGALIFWIILLARTAQNQAYALAHRMTRDLETSRERLLMAQSSASFGAWDWDFATNITVWTDEQYRLYGIKPGTDIRYSMWEAHIHPEDLPFVQEALQRAIRTHSNYASEFRIKAGDGAVRWIAGRGKIYQDTLGKPVRMVGIDMDITDRKKFETQLLQSQKMETVGTLAGGIAHDLNNQLSPLLGYVDLILQQTAADHPNYGMLEEARTAGERCADIVKRLLHFSRPSTQKKEPMAFSKVIDELKVILPKFLPSTIKSEFKIIEPLGTVLANETELQSMFMNLAANARDAMPDGGTITIESRTLDLPVGAVPTGKMHGRYAFCSFRDTGTGMPPEVLTRIFEPFFSTKERGKGTGLGLAMVFSIVKDHGGWLDVASRPGEGTTFQIFLPLSDCSPSTSKGAREKVLPRGEGSILFADDEEYMRNLGKTYLEQLGYSPVLVASGPEAVARFERDTSGFAAVVLDMTMPGQTGLQTIRRILHLNPNARILVASGHTTEGTPEELRKIGVLEYIHKPYTIQMLADALVRVTA